MLDAVLEKSLHKIESYPFIYRNTKALLAVDLVYREDLTRKEAAEKLEIDVEAINGLCRNNFSTFRTMFLRHKEYFENFLVEFMISHPWALTPFDFNFPNHDMIYILNFYGDVCRYVPTHRNLRSYKNIKNKYGNYLEFLNEILSNGNSITLIELFKNKFLTNGEMKLNLFRVILSCPNLFRIIRVDNYYSLVLNKKRQCPVHKTSHSIINYKSQIDRLKKDIKTIINQNDVYPKTFFGDIIFRLFCYSPNVIIQIVHEEPFVVLNNDCGRKFVVDTSWGKGKTMLCCTYNSKCPVTKENMNSYLEQMGKKLLPRDLSIHFEANGYRLLYENGKFRVTLDLREESVNFSNE